ncbi:MAG TPA: FecR domain-containing protein, partial [Gemmatimonadales bacterium]|nr:FecR domain-containing protein [Gemmatimonadales bacterium]
ERLGEASRRGGCGQRADSAWPRMRERLSLGETAPRVLRLERPAGAGSARPGSRRTWWRRLLGGALVAATLGALAIGGARMLGTDGAVPAPIRREVVAPRGGRAMLGLPDGTRVVLGPETRLRYAMDDGSAERLVYLDGVAHFHVAADPRRPFVVHAGAGAVQVVGTVFGVRAYADDSVLAVVVAEGRVALRPEGGRMGSGTMLEPGQRGLLGEDGVLRVESAVDVARELGWIEGRLAYDLVPLDAVVRDLERWFDLRIALADSSLAGVRITLTLDAASADAALRRLAAVLDARYTRDGRDVRIGG